MTAFPTPSELSACPELATPPFDDQLMYTLRRHGFDNVQTLAAGLGVNDEVAAWLLESDGACFLGHGGRPVFTPVETFPAAVARAVVAFRRLLSWATMTVAERPKVPVHIDLPSGDVNTENVAWLVTNTRGASGFRAASLPNPHQRVQSLVGYSLSIATVAKACDTNVSDVERWLLADVTDLPWNAGDEAFERFNAVLRFLSMGPARRPMPPAPRVAVAGDVY